MMTSRHSKVLWDRWIDLWNGELEQEQEIIHQEFAIHRIPPPRISDQLDGREGLLVWIRQTRSLLQDLRLTVEGGADRRWRDRCGSLYRRRHVPGRHPGQHCTGRHPRALELAVTAAIRPVADGVAGPDGDGRCAVVAGKGRAWPEAIDAGDQIVTVVDQ
jgi:hypothetical protein